MLSEKLLLLNKRGIIPGPQEMEEAFWKRADALVEKNAEAWQETHPKTSQLFDFSLDWVEVFYSKKSLPAWQGAITWIDEIPKIQLHPQLKKGSLLKIYSREEVLSHEAVHAARSQFSEPRFEEHFAYLTTKSPWRRFLGPFFRTSAESTLFLLLLLFCTLAPLFGFPQLFILSIGAVAFGLIRLTLSQYIFKQCQKKLSALVKDPATALSVMLRLTDKEIDSFAKSSPDKISAYIAHEKKHCLRWKVLSAAYF